MKCTGMLILSMMVAFSVGLVFAQDVADIAALADLNVTNITNLTNATNVTNMTAVTNATAAIETINVTEAPVEEVPVVETPVVETPVVETPVNETPVVETPVNETPMNETPAEEVAVATETASRFKQLSNYTAGTSMVLGKALPEGYSDVATSADRAAVFSRDSGIPAPSVKVTITRVVDTPGDKYVQVANEAVGEWDMTGWTLESAGVATFVFPELVLNASTSIKVHEGMGAGTATDIYTNSTEPLWIDNIVTLKDAAGNTLTSYDVTTAAAEVTTEYVDPWKDMIQY
ncbi:lamin tail domain-containing protein [Methanothrix soehngenii]|uniref:lamin tail domain-containing protein n=1 Tax=Methanothrix soehngenii TaxID=2223 RepID=UPI0023F2A5FB|nr:lamin tail domain-containing protein [Methanothrix soehngenii]MCK9587541.1 lamin tail domain-containing protein [Methanothrix soehngenii]MDD5257824.1 lamin tail domain-containing protein [Methanothrix soehngenii]